MRKTFMRAAALVAVTAAAVATAACANGTSETNGASDTAADSYKIGINQLVQHPALDAANAGFKRAFDDAGVDVDWTEQNANGEQGTALTIAQSFANSDLDLVYAIATPAAQATAQTITDIPVLFSAVTDPEAAELVKSNSAPGNNVTGTSDLAEIKDQLALLKQIVPDAKKVGIVYANGEVNSQVQVDAAKKAAADLDLEIVTQTVAVASDLQQATDALGDVDAIYVPTDNLVVSGIAAVVNVAEQKKIPVIGAEAGTVEGGAVATLGIDYDALGYQTGQMALKILKGQDPAKTPVEFANEYTYVVNEAAAARQGVTIPAEILDKAEKISE
ncbi:ABC transporter substrate-binding protein [Canibacter zhoujuaniae]|uniref:ABC transporter substrate-binding protein n=1 Tax=Canibacter zhoujuaniae TaxID=2708343 RepID=UPI001422D02F|nr:ABC transporter substrate-binding protein [Canibacter zhoujuaniae]